MSLGGQAEQVALVGRAPRRRAARPRPRSRAPRCRRPRARPGGRPLAQLGRAGPAVGAADVLVALLLGASGVPQAGHFVGMTNSRSVPSRRSTTGPTISGMTSPALRSTTVSPMSTPLRSTSCGVVQRRPLDGGAGDDDRLHHAERRDPAGAADVDLDVEELGVDLLGRVLEGDRPARRAAGGAEPALQRDLVDLDDDAVDLVLDVVAVLAVVLDEGLDLLDRVDDPEVRGDRQAPRRERGVGLATAASGRSPSRLPRPWTSMRSGATGGDPRVLLPQRPGRGVARVGEGRLAGLDELRVELARTPRPGSSTSPRTSTRSGTGCVGLGSSRSGCRAIVRTLGVTSSPVRPSPRVSARISRPFS